MNFPKTRIAQVMGEEETLPTHMRALGYQTAAIGKMHFTPQRRRHGFEEMVLPDDYYREVARSGEIQQPMRHGLGQNELHPTMATVPESRTLTAWTADRCADYIRHRRDPAKPFLLWCSFSKPHPPLDPPEPYYSMYKDAPIPDPVVGGWADDAHAPAAFRHWRQCRGYDLMTKPQLRAARAAAPLGRSRSDGGRARRRSRRGALRHEHVPGLVPDRGTKLNGFASSCLMRSRSRKESPGGPTRPLKGRSANPFIAKTHEHAFLGRKMRSKWSCASHPDIRDGLHFESCDGVGSSLLLAGSRVGLKKVRRTSALRKPRSRWAPESTARKRRTSSVRAGGKPA
jgi:hypothetical protein